MSDFNFEKFIVDTPPYKRVELGKDDVLKLSRMKESRVEDYCNKCCKNQTFVYSKFDFHDMSDIDGSRAWNYAKEHVQDLPQTPELEIYKDLDYYCAMCGERHEYFFTTDRQSIMKVGQNPSFADLKGVEINKYKNLIPKYFIEFKSSLSCYSLNKGIAAFVYLRRILEDIIDKKYKKVFSNGRENIHFIDKFKQVQEREEIIPKEFNDMKNALYTVLSKGVHEYEEDECLEMYDSVKFVIEEILDKQLIEKERQNKIRDVKQRLNNKLYPQNDD